jgi:phenylpropionate dioxygenase-like ring-hydroxylating dioxygenase large terminal subunit
MLKDHWYPLATSEGLGRDEARAVTLFGEPLVLFRDHEGQAVCLQDRCPHRSTPLSLGRVTEGRIECLYHGWQFGQGGTCLRIPSQPADARIPERATAAHKACREERGLIWVWGGEEAQADPARMLRAPFAPFEDPAMFTYLYDTAIEIPAELMAENLLDPAHLPFTHHGTMSRRSMAQPIRMEDVDDPQALIAGAARFQRPKQRFVPAIERAVLKFYAPCVVTLELLGWPSKRGRAMRTYQVHFCVPADRARMAMFSVYGATFGKSLQRWMKPMFRSMAAKAIGQDIKVLQAQHAAFERGAPAFDQAVGADRLTLRYRQWLEQALPPSIWFERFCPKDRAAEAPLRQLSPRTVRVASRADT